MKDKAYKFRNRCDFLAAVCYHRGMTLTTHGVIGAAVARIVTVNPVLGFCAGFASHFLIDAIPHGHYQLRSKTYNPENKLDEDMALGWAFIYDIARIGLDLSLGVFLAFIIFLQGPSTIPVIFWGAMGGILPDALQFVYWKIRKEPLISLQRFHGWIHAEKHYNGDWLKTIAVECAVIVLVSGISLLVRA